MVQLTIHYRIRPDGVVEELVSGVRGAACEQLTERIEGSLGAVQIRHATTEALPSAALDTHVRQTVQQHTIH